MEFSQKNHHSTKKGTKGTMPPSLKTGSKVSSVASNNARFLELQPGKKRRAKERLYGVIICSVSNGMWEVMWEGGIVESMSPSNLKKEGEPTEESLELVQKYHREM